MKAVSEVARITPPNANNVEFARGYHHATSDVVDLVQGGFTVEQLLAWEQVVKAWRWADADLRISEYKKPGP